MSEWIENQVSEFESLRGCTISNWNAVEMALLTKEHAPHVFELPNVPFIQATPVAFDVDAKNKVRTHCAIDNYQNDDVFGLHFKRAIEPLDPTKSFGIFRWRPLTELPTGIVDDVTVRLEQGDIQEVELVVNNCALLFLSGEVEDTWNEELVFRRFDESVLIFQNVADVDRIDWKPPRRPLA